MGEGSCKWDAIAILCAWCIVKKNIYIFSEVWIGKHSPAVLSLEILTLSALLFKFRLFFFPPFQVTCFKSDKK